MFEYAIILLTCLLGKCLLIGFFFHFYFEEPIWIYIIGCGVLALVTPFALSAGRSSATSFVASSMMPMAFIDNAADMVVNGGRLIPWNMMAATANLAGTAGANLAGTAGIGIFNNAMNFASNGIITPKLG